MKKFNTKKTIFIGSIILIAGIIATAAFAHMGGGYNNMMGGGMMGYGGQMMGNGYMMENLSAEDQQKMLDQMNSFFSSTKEIREQSYKKQLELNQEFLKADKDQGKIDDLQKELFELSSKFEEQRFNHYTNIQKLFTDKTGTNASGAGFTGMGMGSGYSGC